MSTDPKAPIIRGSTKETLEDIYMAKKSNQSTAILRDSLKGNSTFDYAQNPTKTDGIEELYTKSTAKFKEVGTQGAATNFVDISNTFSDGFKVKDGNAFTDKAMNWAQTSMKLDTTSYAPSGRK